MVKYTIYEIVCKDPNIKSVYVGHTKNFTNRYFGHTNPYNDNPKSKLFNYRLYKSIRDNGGWDNWIMRPIEIFNGNDKDDALIREQYWIDEKKTDLNQVCAIDKNEIRRERNKKHYKKRKVKKFDNMVANIVSSLLKEHPEKTIDVNELKSYIKQENNITWF